MISTSLKIGSLVLLVAAGAGLLVLLRLDNARLRNRISNLQRQSDEVARLSEGNQRLRTLLERAAVDESAAAQAIRADVLRARDEIVTLEKRAREAHGHSRAKSTADAEALAINRDPANGVTRLEYFQNVGRGTPAAAFQTLAWAALKGDEQAVADMVTLTVPAREKADALIAGLPEVARARWTPEKLAVLFFTGFFSEASAAQVINETPGDAQHATVMIRATGAGKDANLPLQFQMSATGWQVVVSEQPIAALQRRIRAISAPPDKK